MPALRKRQKTDDERKAALLEGNIRKHQAVEDISDEKIAAILSIHRDTYRRKRSHPDLFTYTELVLVFRILRFTDAEILESI